MHTEILPAWLVPAVIVVMALLVALWLVVRLRDRARIRRRDERRIRRRGYARAWDAIMGRRAPRLTDQRPKD